MYPVSQDFHEKMKAQSRRIYGKIQVDYTDPFIDQSIQVSVNENANYSYPEQAADSIQEPYGKIASLDGSWVLDGTYVLAPTPEEAEELQMGWWGSQLSDSSGNYTAPYPTLSVTFAPRPIRSLQVIADNKRKEWPVNFEINLYSNDTLMHTETVTDNTDIFWSTDIERVNEITKMELIITKWSHANRQVKILEFFTSIQETYETDDILLINLLEEREVSQGSLPVGNISSNEIDIRLVNENGRFDAGNRDSPLYQLLKQNRRIKAWLGTYIDYDIVPTEFLVDTDAEWNQGTLTNVVAVDGGLELKNNTSGQRTRQYNLSHIATVNDSEIKWEEDAFTGLSFDGIDDYVGIYKNFGSTNAFSIGGWFKNIGSREFLVDHNNQGGWTFSGDTLGMKTDGGSNWKSTSAPDLTRRNDLLFVVMTWDGSTAKRYVNGKVDATLSVTGSFILYPRTIGARINYSNNSPYNFSSGKMKDLFIFKDKALSIDEINNIYFNGLTGNEDNLVLYYPMNEGSGSVVNDLVGNKDGNIYGCNWIDTSTSIETNLSLDNGQTWLGWKQCTSGESIPDITAGMDLSNAILDTRQTLSTNDTTVTPRLERLKITINGIEYFPEPELKYIPLGTFWSGDWTAPEGEIYVQTTGRDRLELLNQSTYSNSQVRQNVTLYDLAIDVLEDYELEPEDYFVDEELQNTVIPYAYFTPQSHREALRKIAEACLGQCYCDRDGLVRLEGYSYLQSKTKPDIVITRDDYFMKDNPNNYMQIANYIEVETQPLRPAPVEEVYRSNEPVGISAGETISITAYYNVEPCIEATASVEGTGSIADVTYYSWGADVKVTSSVAGEFELVINAKPLKVQGAEKVVAFDEDSIRENGRIKYTFPKNPLVQTREQAQQIADNLLAYFKDPRRDLTAEWRGNPALLLGDRIQVVDEYGREDFFITMQNIEYDGGLKVSMEGRKADGVE